MCVTHPPNYRSNDPGTSKQAGEAVDESLSKRQAIRVYHELCRKPGQTAGELEKTLKFPAHKRAKDCVRLGLIHRRFKRPCGVTGRNVGVCELGLGPFNTEDGKIQYDKGFRYGDQALIPPEWVVEAQAMGLTLVRPPATYAGPLDPPLIILDLVGAPVEPEAADPDETFP
jgi:hypothetical protein